MQLGKIYDNVKEALRTAKGRNILTFLVFLAISTVFWFLLALNDDVQKDYTLPVQLEEFPEGLTLLSGYSPVLNVTVKDKGASLMRYQWGHNPSMKIRFDEFSALNDSVLLISAARLNSAVRGIFGTAANIVAIRPDSLKLTYTTNPGMKVPVTVDCDIHTMPQFAYSGHPECDIDSVMIYSNLTDRYKIHSISTKQVVLADVADTTSVNVALNVSSGVRAIPSSVLVTFPVEPLVAKMEPVQVEVVNAPYGERIVTFPAMTEVSYLVPKSMYNLENVHVRATVDYNDIHRGEKTLFVTISGLPSYARTPSLNPDRVEYVIERNN